MDSSLDSVLRVQITHIDHTTVSASELDNTSLPKAPVIRIFGTSSTGQKGCLHIHQVYPYFMVEYLGKTDPESGTSVEILPFATSLTLIPLYFSNAVNRYIATLIRSLNLAIAVSYKRDPESPNSRFVRAIVPVKGVHFYGFHSSYSLFLKIHIVDPAHFTRAIAITQSGSVMDTRFRVFEGHLSFILQFMCDYNLYGCAWIELSKVWQRSGRDGYINGLGGIKVRGGADESMDLSMDTDAEEDAFPQSPCFRESRMALEVDTIAAHILNRHQLTARDIHHKLTIPAPPLPSEPLVLSVRELWEDERRRRAAAGLTPLPPMPVDPSEASRAPGGNWVSEERYRAEIKKKIAREKGSEVSQKEEEWERWVMTTFESVEALWPSDLKTRRRPGTTNPEASALLPPSEAPNPYHTQITTSGSGDSMCLGSDDEGDTSVEVNESMLLSQELATIFGNEEADWTRRNGDDNGDDNDNGEQEMADQQGDEYETRSQTVTPNKRHMVGGETEYVSPAICTITCPPQLIKQLKHARNTNQQSAETYCAHRDESISGDFLPLYSVSIFDLSDVSWRLNSGTTGQHDRIPLTMMQPQRGGLGSFSFPSGCIRK